MAGRIDAVIRGAGVVIVAGVLAGGGAYVINESGGGPAEANAFVNTDVTGDICTRSSTPKTFEEAEAANELCGTLDAAYDVASCGDTVLIKGGTYGNQVIEGDRTCGSGTWTVAASKGVTMTGGVLMEVASGESATFGDVDFHADWLEFSLGDGALLKIDDDNGIDNGAGNATTANVIIRGVDMNDMYFNGAASSESNQMDNIAIVDSRVGPWPPKCALCAEPVYMQGCTCGGFGGTIGTDIVFDGVYWHDIESPGGVDPHVEALRIDGGYDGVTVRNSDFWDNVWTNTGTVLHTNAGGAADPRNVSFINNYFGTNGPSFYTIVQGSPTCTNLTVAYNTFLEEPFQPGCTHTGTKHVGNLGPKADATCYSGVTSLKNVWQHSSSTACGTDTWVNGTAGATDALGLGGTNGFDLQNGSVAEEAGETTNCPALDHGGEARPNGGTNCDAGADERP